MHASAFRRQKSRNPLGADELFLKKSGEFYILCLATVVQVQKWLTVRSQAPRVCMSSGPPPQNSIQM